MNGFILDAHAQEEVIRLFVKNAKPAVLEDKIPPAEGGLPPRLAYFVKRGLHASRYYDFEDKKGCLASFKKSEDKPIELTACSFDIEVYNKRGRPDALEDPVLMIGAYDGKPHCFYWTQDGKGSGTEQQMIKDFIEFVKKNDFDVLVTYNGANFDIPYLKKRCKQLGLKLDLGRDGSEVEIRKGGVYLKASVFGRVHLDAFDAVEFLTSIGGLRLPSNDLDSVYKALFGKDKTKIPGEKIFEYWEKGGKSLETLKEYNEQDASASLEIGKEVLPLFLELSKIIGLPLFEVARMSASQMVEWLLVREAHERGIPVPDKVEEGEARKRMMHPITGAFVKEPEPGLHENVVICDFKSMYPTIIITHNVSPDTLDLKGCKDSYVAPEVGHRFCKSKKGLIPVVLEELLKSRAEAQKQMKGLDKKSNAYRSLHFKQWALKIISNATYGYCGYARARWYCREAAESITAWGRHYIYQVMKSAENAGFKPIYADSITKERFVTLLDPKNNLKIKNIEQLFEENNHNAARRGEKEVIPLKGWKALTISARTGQPCFEKVSEIIRHKTTKSVFRVNQKFGETRVTEDHSLIIKEGAKYVKVKPKELNNRPIAQVLEVPPLKQITKIDLYALLNNYSHELVYKNRSKKARVGANHSWVWFGWTNRKKPIKLKRLIRTNTLEFESLCRLLGAYIAEGSASTLETCSRLGASIATSDVHWLKQLQNDYLSLFPSAKACVIPSMRKKRSLTYTSSCGIKKTVRYKDDTYKLQMMNQLSAVFFKQLCGQKSTGKKLPDFIFHAPKKYKKILLDNMIRGDGSTKFQKTYSAEYCLKNFKYATSSLGVASGLSTLLTQLGQKHTIQYRPQKKAYSIITSARHNRNWTTKVVEEKYGGYVYDLSVENSNMFTDSCGQLLLHNTDAIFFKLGAKKERDAEKLVQEINDTLPERMELELKGFYPRCVFVATRGGKTTAKKRYALINKDGTLEIVGFEFVRRDWANIAKKAQEQVIQAVLSEGKPEKAVQSVKKIIRELRENKVSIDDLKIYTQVTRSLASYEQQAPHVKAAKKLVQAGIKVPAGSTLEFIVVKGPGQISDRSIPLQLLTKDQEYDAEYYVHNQVLPAVAKILAMLGVSEEDLAEKTKQKGLHEWT